ncbi:hypothetical protein FPSE_12449, partial [Fusarium pseudograminearum CS3096]
YINRKRDNNKLVLKTFKGKLGGLIRSFFIARKVLKAYKVKLPL